MFADELSILALYGLLMAVTLLLQVTGAMSQLGAGYVLSSRDEGRSAQGITARLERALDNSVTALALFAAPVLILAVRNNFSENSLLSAQIFLAARVVYLPAYAFRLTGVRTLAWLVGFAATVVLYLLAL